MKATLKYSLYRRPKPTNEVKANGYLAKGSVIEVEEIVEGRSIDRISKWYKAKDGFYYWGGGISELGADETHAIPILRAPVSALVKETQTWFSDALKIPAVWNDFNAFGQNVTAAILDTGYDTQNVDLAPGVVKAEKFISYAESFKDINGHGTRCASLIGCRNSLTHNIGVAPRCDLLIGKISNLGEMSDYESMMEGLKWSISNGAEIISISYGKPSQDQQTIESLHDRISSLIVNKNVLIFACSGNNYEQTPTKGILYPSAFSGQIAQINRPPIEKIISIGAIDNQGRLSPITLLNDYTVLHAPGINIKSYQLNSVPDLDSGTSMATPIAAGIAVLAVSLIKRKNGGQWNAAQLKKMMIDSADPIVDNPSRYTINPIKLFNTI